MDEVVEKLEESVAELLVEIRRPKSTIESIVKTLEAEKFEESNIELFVEAVYEAAERVDEEADEIIVEKLSLIRLLRLLLIKLPEARQLMIILPENESKNLLSNLCRIGCTGGRGSSRRRG